MCSTLNMLEFHEHPFLRVLLYPSGVEDGWGGVGLDSTVKGVQWCPCQVGWALQNKITCNAM